MKTFNTISLFLSVCTACFAGQSTNTFTLQVGQATNFPVTGAFDIVSLTLIPSATNFASVTVFDSRTSNTAYITPATSNIQQILTPFIVAGTNGDGSGFTNTDQAYVPTLVVTPATTNPFAILLYAFTLTNQSCVIITNQFVACQLGFSVTNSGPGPVTVISVTTNAP